MNDSGFNGQEVTGKLIGIVSAKIRSPHVRVFYFGSRVEGRGTEKSDLDLGIEAEDEIPGKLMIEIKELADSIPIMQKIDVVDFKRVSAEFKKVALQKIEVIYEK
ncbi:MAG TPA: nucleotidyltransferase domain-containing protein [Candidatus Sulfotelmatobacter sp.]|nr:nucleotidyltransferase domain-containing protein [Candidatus Sulfotelmatobacter sp.]